MERRYPELYKQCERREREGRFWYEHGCWIVGGVVFLLIPLIFGALGADRHSEALTTIGFFVGFIVAGVLFIIVRRLGWHQIIEAQKTLVLVDTENNTRQLVSIVSKMAERLTSAKPAAAALAE
jgi:cytosine/uracil/thiamine/allantoin permease